MIISIVNTKGGVGKTVTCVHLGAALARAGYSTLLIDVDLQHGLTSYFNLDTNGAPTTGDVLLHGRAIHDALLPVRSNLSVVPADSTMERAEVELAGAGGGELRLRRALRGLTGFDFCLIDCPSGWNTVTRNALLASTAMIVPINSEPAAVECARSTEAAARELCDLYDHPAQQLHILLTRFRATKAARAVEHQVCRDWPDNTLSTKIRQAERINELAIMRETMSDVSASVAGPVGEDYEALAREVIERCQKQSQR
jgi:chromosome partitioning protein